MLAGMFASNESLEARVRKALFSASEPGWMHRIHPNHVRANSDGSGAVAVGDSVGWVEDLSGNGNHASQVTATARAFLRKDAAGYYLDPDGVDDCYQFPTIIVSGRNGRMLAFSGSIAASPSGTRAVIGRVAGGGGYLGRFADTGWFYFAESSGVGVITADTSIEASVIGTYRGEGAFLRVNTTEQSAGALPSSEVVNYGFLLHNGGSNIRPAGKYRGGVLNVREPSTGDVDLVARWLDKLRGA